MDLFRRDTGRLPVGDPSAARAGPSEAAAFCAWLGAAAGLPMRLPTGAEWEWAARSGGHAVLWPTADGALPAEGADEAALTNPLGLHGMTEGQHEWAVGAGPGDAPGTMVLKGSSDASSTGFETLATRYPAEPLDEAARATLEGLGLHIDVDGQGRAWGRDAAARCLAEVAAPPPEAGFGFARDAAGFAAPAAYLPGGAIAPD